MNWTDEDSAKLTEYLQKEGYETLIKRLERMKDEMTSDMIRDKNETFFHKIETISTIIRVLEAART